MNGAPDIRMAVEADADEMQQCVAAAYAEHEQRTGHKPVQTLYDYGQVIRLQEAFVADHDGQIVGVLVLIRGLGGAMVMDTVCILPDRQGVGLGRRLLTFAETFAVSQGFSRLDVYTPESIIRNLAMFLFRGFDIVSKEAVDGNTRVHLSKELSCNH